MAGHRVGYVRVSTLDHDEKRQLEGQVLDRDFTDKASGRDTSRPELTKLVRFARDGDTVVVHSMDRLARNLNDLRALVQRAHPVWVGGWSSSRRVALAKQRGAYRGRKNTLTPERAAELVQRAASGVPNPSSPATTASAGKRCTSTSHQDVEGD